jgi:hypothetical protein
MGMPTAAHQIEARPSMYEFYRDAGIDMALYGDTPGLVIDRGMGNPRDRGGHGANPAGGVNLPIEALTMYRDFDFLDQPALDACHAQKQPGAFIFNCWVEAWGEHVWFQPDAGDTNLAQVAVMDGKPAEGVLRMNSRYPEDGFWWDSQLRITPPFQGGVHFLEPFAQAVADLDACRITRGGLFLDTAHSAMCQSFARAYRALPRETFENVGDATDPVAVRTRLYEGAQYFYAVNREYYPIEIEIAFTSAPEGLRDLATNESIEAGAVWRLSLGPYELRAFRMEPAASVESFTPHLPPEMLAELSARTEAALRAIETTRKAGHSIAGMDRMEVALRDALMQSRLAWLRRALNSYIVRKAVSRQPTA